MNDLPAPAWFLFPFWFVRASRQIGSLEKSKKIDLQPSPRRAPSRTLVRTLARQTSRHSFDTVCLSLPAVEPTVGVSRGGGLHRRRVGAEFCAAPGSGQEATTRHDPTLTRHGAMHVPAALLRTGRPRSPLVVRFVVRRSRSTSLSLGCRVVVSASSARTSSDVVSPRRLAHQHGTARVYHTRGCRRVADGRQAGGVHGEGSLHPRQPQGRAARILSQEELSATTHAWSQRARVSRLAFAHAVASSSPSSSSSCVQAI